METNREIVEKRQTARINRINYCSGGFMLGNGNCDILTKQERGPVKCQNEGCTVGPQGSCLYEPKD